jgi:hypothetical protein
MNSEVNVVSERILEFVEKKGPISFIELENSLNISYNLVFLALDQMVRDNKIALRRKGNDYQISLSDSYSSSPSNLPNGTTDLIHYKQ